MDSTLSAASLEKARIIIKYYFIYEPSNKRPVDNIPTTGLYTINIHINMLPRLGSGYFIDTINIMFSHMTRVLWTDVVMWIDCFIVRMEESLD